MKNKDRHVLIVMLRSLLMIFFKKDMNNYRIKCKNCWIEKQTNYYTNNKDKIIEQHNEYERKKRKIDQKYKLIKILEVEFITFSKVTRSQNQRKKF